MTTQASDNHEVREGPVLLRAGWADGYQVWKNGRQGSGYATREEADAAIERERNEPSAQSKQASRRERYAFASAQRFERSLPDDPMAVRRMFTGR